MQTFAEFISPLSVEEFRSAYFGQRPIHIARDRAAPILPLDWPRLNALLEIQPYWNEQSLKLYYNNRLALRENYCDTTDLRPGAQAPINPAKVKTLLGLGASLVANHVHAIAPDIRACTRMLEQEFGARAFANLYCSFKNVQAFQTHYDLHDVFALQVEGEKLWRVYEVRADAPVTPPPPGEEAEKALIESRGRVLFEALMRPGDVLYLPRGQYHDALTGAQASLHITFGVAPAPGLALFKLLENAAKHESLFRAYLPDARDEVALRAHLANLSARLSAMLASPALLTDIGNHQRGLAGPELGYALPMQREASWYAVRKPIRIERRDAGIVALCEGAAIALGDAYPALEWALQQRFFSREDAAARQPGVSLDALCAALDRLAAAGIIEPTTLNR